MIERIFVDIDEDFWCETRYINNIIDNIEKKSQDDYSIIVTHNLKTVPNNTKYTKIVILIGDEQGNLGLKPYINQNVKSIFRIFNLNDRFDNKYIFPIPPGYNWTMHSDRSKKMKQMYPDKKLSDRKYDIFFAGQPLPWRKPLINNLRKLNNKFNVLSQENPSFRSGIDIDDYYKILGETKIALSPDGTAVDCFRYVEAFGSGCIVITTNKQDLWYYKDSPTFFINSWEELNENLINRILSLDIDNIYEENLKYYKEKLSEEAVANYILDSLTKV